MPQCLVEELSNELYGQRLRLSEFFDHFSNKQKLEISTLMFSEMYFKKVEIIKEGDSNKKLFFIVDRTVAAGIKSLGYPIVLNNGSYFGEDSAIFEDTSNISFVSYQRVCLLYIEWHLLFKILKNHKIDVMSYAKPAFKRAKYFYEATKYKYCSGFYISNDEMNTFALNYKLRNPHIENNEIEEFNERAEKLIIKLIGKKNQIFGLPKEILNIAQKESEKDVKLVCDSYRSGLEKLITKVKILEGLSGI